MSQKLEKIDADKDGDTRVPVRGYMRAMIKTMQAQTAVPHLVFSDEYVMDELIALRRRCQAQQCEGVKITYMPFLVKALSLALSEFPEMNATFSADQEYVIQREGRKTRRNASKYKGDLVGRITAQRPWF